MLTDSRIEIKESFRAFVSGHRRDEFEVNPDVFEL